MDNGAPNQPTKPTGPETNIGNIGNNPVRNLTPTVAHNTATVLDSGNQVENTPPAVGSLDIPDFGVNWPEVIITDLSKQDEVRSAIPRLIQLLSQPVRGMDRTEAIEKFTELYGTIYKYTIDKATRETIKTDEVLKKRSIKFNPKDDGGFVLSVGDDSTIWIEGAGRGHSYPAQEWIFDKNGRITRKIAYASRDSYDKVDYDDSYQYTVEGLLLKQNSISKWRAINPIEIVYDNQNRPIALTVSIFRYKGDYLRLDGSTITVPLAGFSSWLESVGYRQYQKDQVETKNGTGLGELSDYLYEGGILFDDLDSLRAALIAYGNGLPSSGSALEEDTQTENQDYNMVMSIQALLGTAGDTMSRFVDERILNDIKTWDGTYSIHRDFDYDGAGSYHKTTVEINMVDGKYELKLGGAYTGNDREIGVAKQFQKKRGLGSEYNSNVGGISVPVNVSVTPGVFYIPLAILSDKFKLNRTLVAGQEQILEETSNVVVTISVNPPIKDTTTQSDISMYHSTDEEAVWGPLSKGRVNLPKLGISIKLKDGVDRYDPTLRNEVEGFITKYKALINSHRSNN